MTNVKEELEELNRKVEILINIVADLNVMLSQILDINRKLYYYDNSVKVKGDKKNE